MQKSSLRPPDIAADLQNSFRRAYRRDRIAGVDEDPNVTHASYASPPCYMHEIEPVYCGSLPNVDVAALVRALLTEWAAGIQSIDALCNAIMEGAIADDLRKIRGQVDTHCRQLETIIASDAPVSDKTDSLTLYEFTERSGSRHGLMDQARRLLPDLADGPLRDILTQMIDVFPATELTILTGAVRLNSGLPDAAGHRPARPLS